jgi:hypothetical protein
VHESEPRACCCCVQNALGSRQCTLLSSPRSTEMETLSRSTQLHPERMQIIRCLHWGSLRLHSERKPVFSEYTDSEWSGSVLNSALRLDSENEKGSSECSQYTSTTLGKHSEYPQIHLHYLQYTHIMHTHHTYMHTHTHTHTLSLSAFANVHTTTTYNQLIGLSAENALL